MKIVVENIFMCLVLFWKCYFSYKFFTFSQYPNKFYYKKFQNHSQIPTPHTTETPIQPTVANSNNQKPQPPKHHYHTTTTTTKIKITERDRWVEDRWVKGEIARRRDWRRDRAEARLKARPSGARSKARSNGKIERRGTAVGTVCGAIGEI